MLLLPYKVEAAAGFVSSSSTIARDLQMAVQPSALAGPYPWRIAAVTACSSTSTCSGHVDELRLGGIEAGIQGARTWLEWVDSRRGQAVVSVAEGMVRTGCTAPLDQDIQKAYWAVVVGRV